MIYKIPTKYLNSDVVEFLESLSGNQIDKVTRDTGGLSISVTRSDIAFKAKLLSRIDYISNTLKDL